MFEELMALDLIICELAFEQFVTGSLAVTRKAVALNVMSDDMVVSVEPYREYTNDCNSFQCISCLKNVRVTTKGIIGSKT